MVHTSYFNCIATNPTTSDINLEFITNFDNIILESTSQHSMAIIGFSIPNINTPLFTYTANEYIITRGLTNISAPVPISDNGYGDGVVMNYRQFLLVVNSAFITANAGSGLADPLMSYNPATKLFSITLDPLETSPWYFNKALSTRFPTLPYQFRPSDPLLFASPHFIGTPPTSEQETQALWSLNDYSRLVIAAPGLPFDPTYSAVSQSGNPFSIRTLASFENNDMEFNRSAFVYSESGQGNWTLHDLKMSGNLQSIQLQVFAVNLNDQILPVKLSPGRQAVIKLAFVRDDATIL